MNKEDINYLAHSIVVYKANQADLLREDILKEMQYNKSSYYELLQDIKKNGQREPVIEVKGQLVDGWKRVQALVHLGLPIKVKSITGINDGQVKDLYTILHPPVMTACKVKDKVAVIMEELVASNGGYSTVRLAKELTVSETTIKNCKAIYKCSSIVAEAMANGQAVKIETKEGAIRTTTAPSSIRKALQESSTVVTPVHMTTVVKDTTALVYSIKDGEYLKIGVANNVDSRLKALQIGNPRKLELVGTVATATPYELEAKLHSKYSDYSVGGEWFQLPTHIDPKEILKGL